MKLLLLLYPALLISIILNAVKANIDHPVCRKKGQVIDLSDECCLQFGTWHQQMTGISKIIAHELSQPHQVTTEENLNEERVRWCDLNSLSYDEYVACECQASAKLEYTGPNVTVQCGTKKDIASVLSDYPCLPKACGTSREAHTLLLNESLLSKNCEITTIYGNATPFWLHADIGNIPKAQTKTEQTLPLVGFLAATSLLIAGLYWRFATPVVSKDAPTSLDEVICFDDLELTSAKGASTVKEIQIEEHELT
ncbi:expressed unknown protein [Seminavis robusta]|uniref:Uncharacterized protein n=1 Tax=Seminavis robusta TaxID=568900 RepID=A0A9N8DQT3_9STRA|nr:expressed unknown protein [Seminavis robusta]|eukprot:Sro282_g107520.1 n/a (253) ;mRNA; r:42639-43397